MWDFKPDKTVDPGTDFFHHVNNNWLKNNPRPDDYSTYGSFTILSIENEKKIRKMLEMDNCDNLACKVYKWGMNAEKLNTDKLKPIEGDLKAIMAAKNKEELWDIGVNKRTQYQLTTLFYVYSSGSKKDPENTILYMGQDGLGLPDKDFYEDESKEELRQHYKTFLSEMFKYANLENIDTGTIFDLETKIAKIHITKIAARDPLKTWNPFNSYEDLQNLAPNLFLKSYFKNLPKGQISVQSPEYFKNLSILWEETPLDIWKSYFLAKTLKSATRFLSDDFYDIYFNFFGKILSGQDKPKPRWKRTINAIEGDIGEILGHYYSDLYFDSKSKEQALTMVKNIVAMLKIRIENLNWMEQETKEQAFKKLAGFTVKIGFPDEWKDFSKINVDKCESFFEALCKCSEFNFDYEMNEAYKPVNKKKWLMSPHEVNAYYHPVNNEIVFPAGILQKPFFSADQTDAENYGGIGAVIAHECTHGFDDSGKNYNFAGELKEWWSEKDKKIYESRTQNLVDQFDSQKIYGESVQGKLTLGENIADIGGMKISFAALEKHYKDQNLDIYAKPGSENGICKDDQLADDHYRNIYSPAQVVFFSWARVWCIHISKDEAIKRLTTDVHSPAIFRTNVILGNVDGFFKAFNLSDDAKLKLKNVADIW